MTDSRIIQLVKRQPGDLSFNFQPAGAMYKGESYIAICDKDTNWLHVYQEGVLYETAVKIYNYIEEDTPIKASAFVNYGAIIDLTYELLEHKLPEEKEVIVDLEEYKSIKNFGIF